MSRLFYCQGLRVCARRYLRERRGTELADVAGVPVDPQFGGHSCELFVCCDPEAIVVDVDCIGFDVAARVLHLHHRYLHLYIAT
jgi:hypothetical protein